MPRPRNRRRVRFNPEVTYYKPVGVPMRTLEEVELTMPEIESLRLKDYEQLDQITCAEKMQVSQPTFHRLLKEAREKIVKAIIEGKAIKIDEKKLG